MKLSLSQDVGEKPELSLCCGKGEKHNVLLIFRLSFTMTVSAVKSEPRAHLSLSAVKPPMHRVYAVCKKTARSIKSKSAAISVSRLMHETFVSQTAASALPT